MLNKSLQSFMSGQLSWTILLYILLLVFSPSYYAGSGKLKFDHITISNGLSHSSVFSIFQDSRGFLWFGTQDGLNRFDGYSFTVFKYNPFDPNSLSDNWVQSITEDRHGNLWIGTHNGGLYRFDRVSEKFTNYRNKPDNNNSLINNRVWSVFEDRKGYLWIATSGGLDRFDPEKEKFTHYLHDDNNSGSLSINAVDAVYEDTKGIIWIGTWGGGLNRLNPKTGEFTHFFYRSSKKDTPNNIKIKTLYEDKDEIIWIGTYNNGLIAFNKNNGSYKWYFNSAGDKGFSGRNSIMSIFEDSKGTLWLGTHHDGLYSLNKHTGQYNIYSHNPDDPNSLSDNWVQAIYEDHSGILWVGTGSGINKCLPGKQRFSTFFHFSGEMPGLSGGEINSLFEDSNGIIWIGAWNSGLFRFDPLNGSFRNFKKSGSLSSSLPDNTVWSVFEDKTQKLWVGTYAGIRYFDRQKNRFLKPDLKGPGRAGPASANISFIYEDSQGSLWVGTWDGNGLYRIDNKRKIFENYRQVPDDPHSLSDNLITVIFEDSRNNLWIGTNGGGLNLFDRNSSKFISYLYDPNDIYSISNNSIRDIYEDKQGRLWIGTWGGGLNMFVYDKYIFKHFTEKEGLANNVICGILEDTKGNLWVSTNRGLSRFNVRTQKFSNYDADDGPGIIQYSPGHLKCRNGLMLFGGINGMTMFHPDSIPVNPFRPKVVITSFRKFNQETSFGLAMSELKQVKLNYDENVFSIEFAALDYTRPDKNKYAYKLEGFDKDWIYSGSRRSAYYTNLDPGEYKFHIKAANSDDIWNNEATALSIIIVPPYWKTAWFRIIVFLAAALLLAILYNYRVSRLLEIERLRVRIASDLHDDIGSSLTKISLQSELIQEGIEPEQMHNYLKNIASISRELVTQMSDIVWSLDARNDSVENLINKMRDFATTTLFPRQIYFDFSYNGLDLKKKIPVNIRENIFLIFKEAVNNIARHSDASAVRAVLDNHSTAFTMTIEDNGTVHPANNAGCGHGLRNMKMRAERLKGSLTFSADNGFRVTLKTKTI